MGGAEAPQVEGRLYHIWVRPGDVAEYVLLPGDPARSDMIASTWEEARLVARHREYTTYTGVYKGVRVSVTSTGIGGPSTAIAVEELMRAGAHTFIRVGTTGAIQPEVSVGDLVISVAAVRLEGTSKQYVIPEYPAYAHYEVLLALVEAAESLGLDYWLGVTTSTDSFYVGQNRPGFGGYTISWAQPLYEDLRRARVLNFDMETSTIFTLASLFGARAGSVCAAVANRVTGEFSPGKGVDKAIRTANEAVRILSEWDHLKKERGKKFFFPSLLLGARPSQR